MLQYLRQADKVLRLLKESEMFHKVKVNLSLCLTKHHTMKADWRVEV
jgi:hypothetical protein